MSLNKRWMRAASGTASAWNQFWFAPADARVVGFLRLTLGYLLLSNHINIGLDLQPLFDPNGPIPVSSAADSMPSPRLSPLDFVSSIDTIRWLFWLSSGIFVAVMIGWRSRLALWLALAVQVFLYMRNPFYQNAGDRIMRLVTFYLALVPTGGAWSVDNWLAQRRGGAEAGAIRPVSMVAQRLVQIQLAVIYVHSGLVKTAGSAWREGSALYYALSNGQYQRSPALVEPILQSPLGQAICTAATHTTLLWEAGFAALLLWRPTRIFAILVGVGVHLGIGLFMNVGHFVWIMLWCYLAFLPAGSLDRWPRQRIKSPE